MKKTTQQTLTAVYALALAMTLSGCASGPYAPKEPQPVSQPVVKNLPEPAATRNDREDKRRAKAKPAHQPVSVNLSISPRDPEQAIDLSVEGPLVIPKEVFE